MKFHQNQPEVKAIPKSITGACIGDQVLFSSHLNKNHKDNWTKQCDITLNKLYTVVNIDSSGITKIINDMGLESPCGGGAYYYGEYDIIIKAPPPPKPEFKPVTLTLETAEEVALVAGLMMPLTSNYNCFSIATDLQRAAGVAYQPARFTVSINK